MAEKASWGFDPGAEIVPGRLVLERLGGGRVFEVFLGFDELLYCQVVIKLVRPDQVASESALRQLRREVSMLEALAHPMLVRIFSSQTEGDSPHLVMEHLDGPRLRSLLKRFGPLAFEQFLPLALNLCAVLNYLSAKEVVHLDVKPGNIVMGVPPRLIDLSLARPFSDAVRISKPVGTTAYMAPEQCDPKGDIGAPADVWGMGVTLFESISGQRPFPPGDPESDKVELKYPQLAYDAASLPESVPHQIADPILACLARAPRDRPLPREVSQLLEPLLEGIPRTPRLSRRRQILR